MGNDAGNGDNNGQGQTTTPPSGEKPNGNGAGTPPAGDAGGQGADDENRTVPYKRFKEVNDELTNLKAKNSAKTLTNGDAGNGQPPKTDAKPATPPSNEDLSSRVKELVPLLKKEGVVTQDDIAVQKRTEEAKSVMAKHDGSDGLPVFDIDKVTTFMKERGLQQAGYEEAYRLLHFDEIQAKAVQDATDGNAGQHGTKPGGGAFGNAPKKGAVTLQGIEAMPLADFKKNGGAKGLRDAVLNGQVQ
jgi:hypothetical protein